jgi:glycine/D-amino acid oxidase-like deaminating enzyme
MTDDYRSLSLWLDDCPGSLDPRPSLESDEVADVAIVGAGFTGLWAAYYLQKLQPGIRVSLVESEIAGFGASGRNGGWCLGGISGIDNYLEREETRAGGIALLRGICDTIDEVGTVAKTEGIDCHFAKGGMITVASTPFQRDGLKAYALEMRELGFGDDFYWLDPTESDGHVRTKGSLGGVYSPHCAAIHPARLARGLADVLESKGVRIYEKSPVIGIRDRRITTPHGSVRADVLVFATEGYTPSLPGRGRRLAPLHSMMIATEPLSEEMWKEIGLGNRECFGDARRNVIYGQRTASGRLAFGGRGSYYPGSQRRDRFSAGDPHFAWVHKTLVSLFPSLKDVPITHRWGGPLGVPRDWRVSVGVDRVKGHAWAGGYVGEGVAATNYAARTLTDLILERATDLVRLPWVGPDFPNWEPEPLRYLGMSAVRTVGEMLDEREEKGESPRWMNAVFDTFVKK